MEDEAVEGRARIHPDDKVSELEAEISREAPAERAAPRRESAILVALAIAGAVIEYPLALTIKSLDRSEFLRAIPFLAITVVLAFADTSGASTQPRARIARRAAARGKDGRREITFLDSQAASSLVWLRDAGGGDGRERAGNSDRSAAADSSGGSAGFKLPKPPMLTVAPGRIALVGALVAIVAAVSEEIQFRLVLYAIFGWIARLMSGDSRGHRDAARFG